MIESLLLDLQAYVRHLNAGLITQREFEMKVVETVLLSPLCNMDLVPVTDDGV